VEAEHLVPPHRGITIKPIQTFESPLILCH